MRSICAAFAAALLLGGCVSTGMSSEFSPGVFGERELRPPRAGIQVGSLYYVRETPTVELSRPANLERLCNVNLSKYGISPLEGQAVADIDLLRKYEATGSLDGVKTTFFSLGFSGSLSDYFEYKLTNVKRTDISYDEAQRIYNDRAFRKDCTSWRGNIAGQRWGIYQIQSVSVGDIIFTRKPLNFGLDANASAKLASIEPQLKASIKREAQAGFNGKGVVASFGPLLRN